MNHIALCFVLEAIEAAQVAHDIMTPIEIERAHVIAHLSALPNDHHADTECRRLRHQIIGMTQTKVRIQHHLRGMYS